MRASQILLAEQGIPPAWRHAKVLAVGVNNKGQHQMIMVKQVDDPTQPFTATLLGGRQVQLGTFIVTENAYDVFIRIFKRKNPPQRYNRLLFPLLQSHPRKVDQIVQQIRAMPMLWKDQGRVFGFGSGKGNGIMLMAKFAGDDHSWHYIDYLGQQVQVGSFALPSMFSWTLQDAFLQPHRNTTWTLPTRKGAALFALQNATFTSPMVVETSCLLALENPSGDRSAARLVVVTNEETDYDACSVVEIRTTMPELMINNRQWQIERAHVECPRLVAYNVTSMRKQEALAHIKRVQEQFGIHPSQVDSKGKIT